MRAIPKVTGLIVASLAISLSQLPVAAGALAGLTLAVTPTSTQSTYGSNPSGAAVDVSFVSTEADGEHLKLSANIVSVPAGQNVQATIAQVTSTNANLEMFDSTSHIKAVNAGLVSAKFTVFIKSVTSSPLAAGTYSMLVYAGSTSGSQQQSVTFVIAPPPTPTLSPGLSRIWMTPGSTPASESNNSSALSGSATADLTNPVANITVDLRDTTNTPMTNLPITAFVQGPGAIGIGSAPPARSAIGRAVIGQPNQYSISLFGDGLFGTSTISIVQNGVPIGTRTFTFTQSASLPQSVSISNVTVDRANVSAGGTVVVQFASTTTSLPTGQLAYVDLNYADDCLDESCNSSFAATLQSGDSSNGKWTASLGVPSTALTGNYAVSIYFPKLKGMTGFYYRYPLMIAVAGVTPKPVPPPATIKFSSIKPSSTSMKVGNLLEVQFDLVSTNLENSEVVQVYLTDDSIGNCDDGCGDGTAKLTKGSITNGSWIAQFTIPNTVPTGNYSLVVAIPKRKGVSGAFAVYSQPIYITGAPRFTPIYVFSSIKTSTNAVRVGQVVTSYFYLKTNDDKVSTPACIIDGVIGWTPAKLIEGTAMSGSWFCSITIPSNAVSGNYKFQVAVVGYANGDKNEQWADLGSLAVSGTTLVQSATFQQCQNYLNTFSSNWSSINSSYNDLKLSLTDPKYSQIYFIGKYRNWSEMYSQKLNIQNNLLIESERMVALSSSNEVISCDFYDFSNGLSSKYASAFSQLISSVKGLNSEITVWYKKMQTSIPDPVKYFNPQIETGAIEIQKVSETTLGKVVINFAYQSSVGVAKIVCSSNYGICTVFQNGASSSGDSYYGIAEITKIQPGAFLNFTLSQLGSTGNQVASFQQTYTSLRAGLQPSLGPITSIGGGCTFKILNYDPAFTWFAKSEMKVARDGTATIYSKELQATDEYISTSRVGYQTVNAINTLFKCVPLNPTSDTTGTNTSTGNTTPAAPVVTIEDDGSEVLPTGTLKVKKESSGRYLLAVSSNLVEEKVTLTASRKGKATIRFSATTNEDGAVQIRTSRNLSGYSLQLIFDGESLKTVKVA